MNRIGLCIVIFSLLAGGSQKTIAEATVSEEIVSQPDERVPARTEIVADDGNTADDFDTVEKFIDEFLSPANESRESTSDEGRTFGVKRLQFMMMPMIYKMGVMMTMIMVLTVISLKTLAIGVLLLILKLSVIFGKLYASTQHPVPFHGWPAQPQPVHVHLHNSGDADYHHHHPPPSYSGWESASGSTDGQHYIYKR